jgi:hypothetical protein
MVKITVSQSRSNRATAGRAAPIFNPTRVVFDTDLCDASSKIFPPFLYAYIVHSGFRIILPSDEDAKRHGKMPFAICSLDVFWMDDGWIDNR